MNVFRLVGQWRKRTETAPLPPPPGSSLYGDDKATDPYQISHAVSGALLSAVDHMDALRALILDAHIVHARAPFTLLRAALENSATAVWLLAPDRRDDRALRRLRLQWADSRDGESAETLFAAEPRLSKANWTATLKGIGQARGWSEDQLKAITNGKVTYTEIVRTAAEEAYDADITERDALFCWREASGIAHAKFWAMLSPILNRVELPGALDDSIVTVKLSASNTGLAMIASLTSLMIMEGYRLLDVRSVPYFVQDVTWAQAS
ncbi:MAG TPA: hypothetical protein VFO01_16095 [Trebonia sp.]|nr:hypothetical protein [Trebonia sp.]